MPWLQAHEPARQGSFPTGALAAAVPGPPVEQQLCLWIVPAVPHGNLPPGTTLGANKRSQEALCAQDRLGSCHCSPQILPRHHLIRLRDGSCAHTAQIQISLPLPSSEHAIFAVCVCSRIFPGPESPRFLNRLRQLQRLRDKMSITLTRLLGKPKSEHSSTAGPRQEQGVLV